ncbi:sensor histidine kinase [Shinella zoogloeoides]|uniref:sensor histidine kinase n=1 Tax=Shinella zoogloeoides TaxID=352475 RepID=UPI00273E4E85|nr:sensor histidine kinase [Shinella zoogloeoides]WLR95326.1 sensor histidine kinase [Shinella zoogloeoides]
MNASNPACIELTKQPQRNSVWGRQSLARQFFIVGSAFSFGAMAVVGLFVTHLIENAVTRNAAASTALYVDSIIAPVLPDMASSEILDETSSRALDETLAQGPLGQRLKAFRLWSPDGRILYSSDPAQIGKQFTPSEDLQKAFSGELVAEFDELDDVESAAERESGLPLLEIYSPLLQPWSGEVVAVTEFYELAEGLKVDLSVARWQSWSAVAAVTLAFFLTLSAIVFRGSKTISHQSRELESRIAELTHLLSQNDALKSRIQRAAAATTALNESYLRTVGADLHDGPAQLVAFAALRVDSGLLSDPGTSKERREKEVSIIKASLDEAMSEIRTICTGLVLPHVESVSLAEMLEELLNSYRARTGKTVELRNRATIKALPVAAKICIYRFIQESLNNGYKHAAGLGQWVNIAQYDDGIEVQVGDAGPGLSQLNSGGSGIGLAGMRDRVESLGGTFHVAPAPAGTIVTMTLPLHNMEAHRHESDPRCGR